MFKPKVKHLKFPKCLKKVLKIISRFIYIFTKFNSTVVLKLFAKLKRTVGAETEEKLTKGKMFGYFVVTCLTVVAVVALIYGDVEFSFLYKRKKD